MRHPVHTYILIFMPIGLYAGMKFNSLEFIDKF